MHVQYSYIHPYRDRQTDRQIDRQMDIHPSIQTLGFLKPKRHSPGPRLHTVGPTPPKRQLCHAPPLPPKSSNMAGAVFTAADHGSVLCRASQIGVALRPCLDSVALRVL